MATIVTRNVKGSALTFTEGDNNFTNLNNDKIELTDLSVGAEGAASGDGSISYDNSTGVFTYTPPDLSSYLTSETFTDVVQDTTPQLGGDLDVNGSNIVSTSGGNISIVPDTDGDIILTASGTGVTSVVGDLYVTNEIIVAENTITETKVGNWDTAYGWGDHASAGYLNNVVEDTTPQLGGTLDGQGNEINNVILEDYKETIYTGGSTTGTITPDVVNGNVQSITLSGNITFSAFANPETGQSMTLIVKQPSSGGPYTLTSTMKFAGGTKTLSTTANAIDIISVVYDGTNYYASLSTNFS